MYLSFFTIYAVFTAVTADNTIWQYGRELIDGAKLPAFEDVGRIIGGSSTTIDQYPWQVSLQFSSGSHTCGGTIVSPTWIVTAAHCTQGSSYRIRAGSRRHSSGGVTRTVKRIINHPEYGGGFGTFANDISLLELSEALQFSSDIQPISLPPTGEEFDGDQCFISGWGRTCGTCGLPSILQHLEMLVIPNSECQNRMNSISGAEIASFHICIYNDQQDHSSCNGDSGGPMTCYIGSTPYLAGATSWGISNSETGCLMTYPSVYTRVSSFDSFIKSFVTNLP